MTVYLDASALVKLVVPEAESRALLGYLAEHPVQATSVIATTEVARAVQRRPAGDPGRVPAVLNQVAVMALTGDLAAQAGRIGPPTLRSLDAVHLASALGLGSDLEALVTYDERLADAARAIGLTVVSPGA